MNQLRESVFRSQQVMVMRHKMMNLREKQADR